MTATDPPFVDEHTLAVDASGEQTWVALHDYVEKLAAAPHHLLFRVLGTVPRSGFEVVGTDPPHEIALAGRHRFSTYRLVFRVDAEGQTSRLRALTYAAFPGLHGRLYRTGLMVTTGHARATRGMLRTVARRAEARTSDEHLADCTRPTRGPRRTRDTFRGAPSITRARRPHPWNREARRTARGAGRPD